MAHRVHPSIIFQRGVSLLTGREQPTHQRYSSIDPSTVHRPVGIGAKHVHAASIKLANARVLTTVRVIDRPIYESGPEGTRVVASAPVVVEPSGRLRAHSLAWVESILKGEF